MTPENPASTAHDGRSPSREIEVLVVDDDEIWGRTAARLLERTNEDVSARTVTTLRAASRTYDRLDPDCVVCDYKLGDGNGIELLEAVRADDPERPFVLVTGEGDEGVASEAISRGATDYISKDRHSEDPERLGRRVTSAVRSYRTQQALARERRSKQAMLDIVTSTTTRETLCRAFCEHLVEEHGYAGAWIGSDEGREGLVVESAVGCGEYLGAVDRDRQSDQRGPPSLVARARGDLHVVDRIDPTASERRADPERKRDEAPADWEAVAESAGYASAASVPIEDGGRLIGVLTVFADGTDEFDDRERHLLREYAETIAHALRTTNWKRTLVSTVPVTVELRFDSETAPLVAFGRRLPNEATVSVVSTAIRGEQTLLYLVRADGVAPDEVPPASSFDRIRSIDVADAVTPLRIELVVARPTPEGLLAERGARVTGTTVEDGTATVSVTYPEECEIRSLTAALEAAYPGAEIVRIRSDASARSSAPSRTPDLTPKQRQALELAYHEGYFDRPREHNATEIADKLGISRVTFSQHLRAAERKVLAHYLDASD